MVGPKDDPAIWAKRVQNVASSLEHLYNDSIHNRPSDAEISEALTQNEGHCGHTVRALYSVPPPSHGIDCVVDKGEANMVLPEYMMQKIENLGSYAEKRKKEEDEIREKFMHVDRDNNGTLDVDEFTILVRELGNKDMDDVHVKEAYAEIDDDNSGEVNFQEFKEWWKRKVRTNEAYALKFRNVGIKATECRVMVPTLNTSDKAGAESISTRISKFFTAPIRQKKTYWVELTGSRLTVYRSEQDRAEKGRIQLTDVEVTKARQIGPRDKQRFGIDFMVHNKLTTVTFELLKKDDVGEWVNALEGALNKKSARRSGKELWAVLSSRITLVCQMQKHWGDIHSLYGDQGSVYEATVLPGCIRHPNSRFSLCWDMMQIFLLMSVCFYVPMRMGFDIEVELWTFEFFFDVFTDVYFIIDVFVNFRSAYVDEAKGVLVTDSKLIAKVYLRSWFLIDFFSCLPVGYIQYFEKKSEDGSQSSNMRLLKVLRLLRLGKMLRLGKFSRMLKKYDSIAELKPVLAVFSVLGLVCLAAHLLSCAWFAFGTNDQIVLNQTTMLPMVVDGQQVVIEGWVQQKSAELEGGDWWGKRITNANGDEIKAAGHLASSWTRYITSTYGIFNGLENAFTDSEKFFAIFSELIVGSLIYGGLAAILTDNLANAGEESREFNNKYKALKTWMDDRGLQRSYQLKVLNYYSHKYKNNVAFDQEELLDELPPAMSAHLMYTLYGNLIKEVPYFRGLDEVVLVKLSSIMKPMAAMHGQPIMEEGKVGKEMYILVEGEVVVEKGGVELGYLNQSGSFFGENVVIDPRSSETRTRTVKGA